MELKRRDRAQALTEMVEFIGLPFQFSSKLNRDGKQMYKTA